MSLLTEFVGLATTALERVARPLNEPLAQAEIWPSIRQRWNEAKREYRYVQAGVPRSCDFMIPIQNEREHYFELKTWYDASGRRGEITIAGDINKLWNQCKSR